MTRKSAARLSFSTIVAFPPLANARRDRGLAPQPRHSLARPACLDRSKLDKASLHVLTMLASTPDATARLDASASQVTVIGRKKGVSLALGQMTAHAAEALSKMFWLKRDQEGKHIFYVLTPLARQALEAGFASVHMEAEWPAPHDTVRPPINQKESP